MDFLVSLAEEKVREAMEKGEFENLPGKGKPLKIENLSQLPQSTSRANSGKNFPYSEKIG